MPNSNEYITRKDFDGAMNQIATRFDSIDQKMATKDELAKVQVKVDAIYDAIDPLMKRTEIWHDEHVVLRASHQRLKDTLVRKGVVSQSDLVL